MNFFRFSLSLLCFMHLHIKRIAAVKNGITANNLNFMKNLIKFAAQI